MTKLILHPRKHNFHDTRPQLDKCLTYAPGERGGGGGMSVLKKLTDLRKKNISETK